MGHRYDDCEVFVVKCWSESKIDSPLNFSANSGVIGNCEYWGYPRCVHLLWIFFLTSANDIEVCLQNK
jgi:hypothetical protein